MRTDPGAASRPTTRASRRATRSAAASRAACRSQANLLGPDIDKLYDYSQQLLAKAQKTAEPGRRRSPTTASPARRCSVAVDRARAADLGVRMATVGNTLRLMVAGDDEISTYREGGEQYPVKIRVLESQRRDIEAIGKLTVAVVDRRSRSASTTSRSIERGFGPTHAARATTGSSRSTSAPTSRRATRSTRRRTTCGS